MKKEYMKPTMIVVKLQAGAILGTGSEGQSVYGGEGASGESQLSRRSGWDDDDDDDDDE